MLVPGRKAAKAQQIIEERRKEALREDAQMQDVELLLRGLAEREEVAVKLMLDCLIEVGAVNFINSKFRPGRLNRMLKSTAGSLKPVARRVGFWWFKNNVPTLVVSWLRSKVSFAPQLPQPPVEQARDAKFFTEWCEGLPEIAESDRLALDRVRQRYLHHRESGPLSDGTVNVVVVSALLEMAGLLDPPFRLQPVTALDVSLENGKQAQAGVLEILSVHDRLWIFELESLQAEVSVVAALQPLLSFVAGKLQPEQPTYCTLTNGDEFVFVKLVQREAKPYYDVSNAFLLLPSCNKLYDVLRVLRHLRDVVTTSALVKR
ncbi:hypothetical protein KR51_00014680 [Rubidibacter lacunae KORDI 51-2]|uniref:Uncharacterized protein n=1 Tax=Rubidibacter lacunae KORDI 51-2 TaxID=582515 RepID=U5DM17_9CHRO|nr:hypothetical protein [Rubidibacter lacunae]ERN41932.1 hypothetical protein KR51_00014680 [Rubidibacter lacunae KORDI 51-2]